MLLLNCSQGLEFDIQEQQPFFNSCTTDSKDLTTLLSIVALAL